MSVIALSPWSNFTAECRNIVSEYKGKSLTNRILFEIHEKIIQVAHNDEIKNSLQLELTGDNYLHITTNSGSIFIQL